jgi:hypothetical protein
VEEGVTGEELNRWPRAPRHRLVLVTGCGRSGTRYTTFVLRRLGLDVGHERLGRDGVASWTLAVDGGGGPWGPSQSDIKFDVVLHQVRHPLRVMSSVMTFREESWRFICGRIPCPPTDPLLLRAAAYWCYWNAEAERRAALTFRVEDMATVLAGICAQLGVAVNPSVLDRVPTDVNTRRKGRLFHLAEEALERMRLEPSPWARARLARTGAGTVPEISWDDLRALDPELCDLVMERASGYGYDV